MPTLRDLTLWNAGTYRGNEVPWRGARGIRGHIPGHLPLPQGAREGVWEQTMLGLHLKSDGEASRQDSPQEHRVFILPEFLRSPCAKSDPAKALSVGDITPPSASAGKLAPARTSHCPASGSQPAHTSGRPVNHICIVCGPAETLSIMLSHVPYLEAPVINVSQSTEVKREVGTGGLSPRDRGSA